MISLQQIFIDNLNKIRKEQGLSQMTLSEKCDTTSNYIGQIEMGRRIPSFEKIEQIAAALNIPSYKLFAYNSDDEKETELTTKDYINRIPADVKKEFVSSLSKIIKNDIDDFLNDKI
jgi:transcriptional regulator with XRE-family HTH domain